MFVLSKTEMCLGSVGIFQPALTLSQIFEESFFKFMFMSCLVSFFLFGAKLNGAGFRLALVIYSVQRILRTRLDPDKANY